MKLPYSFGRYTILEKIAAGGTAEVYRAIFSASEGFAKPVAVKRLLPTWGDNEELRKMLIDEARVLVHLQHQTIAQVFELGEFEGLPFLAMEFVDGIDCGKLLQKLAREKKKLPIEHALYIISQVLTALEFAHRSTDATGKPLNIVHRDISPSNILFSWNGEVKVTDFGIAKGLHRSELTAVGQLKGKFAYMSPEQAMGKGVDARADIFSCGIVLYELLTSKRLFDGASDFEVLEKVRDVKIPLDSLIHISPELTTIVILSLAGEPSKRYQSALQMLTEINRYAKSIGAMSSSLEFSEYLRNQFPFESSIERKNTPIPNFEDVPETKILRATKSNIKRNAVLTVLPIILVLIISIFFINSGWKKYPGANHPEGEIPLLEKMFGKSPPKISGAVAIDTNPQGIEGRLILGKEEKTIKTPFTMDNIPVGEGLSGTVEFQVAGFEPVKENFNLTPMSSVFVKKFDLKKEGAASISVNAKPWGVVDIPGVTANREAPVSGIKIKSGAYVVKVKFPPTGQVASTNVTINGSESKHCFAEFGKEAKISCR